MISELKNAFAPYGWLLTAAVSAGKSTIDVAYNIPAMNKYGNVQKKKIILKYLAESSRLISHGKAVTWL